MKERFHSGSVSPRCFGLEGVYFLFYLLTVKLSTVKVVKITIYFARRPIHAVQLVKQTTLIQFKSYYQKLASFGQIWSFNPSFSSFLINRALHLVPHPPLATPFTFTWAQGPTTWKIFELIRCAILVLTCCASKIKGSLLHFFLDPSFPWLLPLWRHWVFWISEF